MADLRAAVRRRQLRQVHQRQRRRDARPVRRRQQRQREHPGLVRQRRTRLLRLLLVLRRKGVLPKEDSRWVHPGQYSSVTQVTQGFTQLVTQGLTQGSTPT